MSPVPIREKVDFIMDFGAALHEYGTPAHRFEGALQSVSGKLGLEGQFLSLPTSIQAYFRTAEGDFHRMLRVHPGAVNLEKVSRLDELGDSVVAGTVSPRDGSRLVQEILQAPERYGTFATMISYGVSAGALACFFRAGWFDLPASVLAGVTIGLLNALSLRSPRMSRNFEPAAAFVAAVLACALGQVLPYLSVPVVILAGVVVLLPGLTLTVAITELATNNLVSGTARLMMACMTFLKLGFGVFLGLKAAKLLGIDPALVAPEAMPRWIKWIALLPAAFAFTISFKARPTDARWVVAAGVIGFVSSALGARALGSEFGLFAGGLAVGVASNLFARYFNRPAQIPLLPGIILLVPGSVGFRGFNALFDHDVVSGVDSAFTAVSFAIALVAGLFFANSLVAPRRNL